MPKVNMIELAVQSWIDSIVEFLERGKQLEEALETRKLRLKAAGTL